MDTVDLFENDLLDCGVPVVEVRPLTNRYARALQSKSHVDWIELYVGVFATVMRNMHRTGQAKAPAAERVLQLINDDLGSDLFDGPAREQLALGLHGAAA